MLGLLIAYGLLMVIIALLFARHQSGDEFLMAGRRVGSVRVGAGVFTLIGGGELVTLTALAYVYGAAGISLFVGYALAFIFLAIISPKIRTDSNSQKALSLPDFAHEKFGNTTGWFVFCITFLAFFALLLLQIVAGGQVIATVLGSSYTVAVIAMASLVFVYLFIGGLKTVFATDLLQAAAMLLLLPILLTATVQSGANLDFLASQPAPLFLIVSLVITGFLVGSASADVWQRIYAARSVRSARGGLVIGAVFLMFYGGLLILLGVAARDVTGIQGPDTAFVEIVTTLDSEFLSMLAVLLVISAVTSTADTELFLLSGLSSRQWLRLTKSHEGRDLAAAESVSLGRWSLVFVWISALVMALAFSDLIQIYSWLLMAILVISPGVLASVLTKTSPRLVAITFWLNGTLLIVGLLQGFINLDNAFLVATPGIALLSGALALRAFPRSDKPS